MIPPEHDSDFVAAMEDVLDVYERPYDPKRPVVCFDEQPRQLDWRSVGSDRSKARAYVKRLEIHHTPKHGSWLNMAEIKFSVLSCQCLHRRMGNMETFCNEVKAWQEARNAAGKEADWQFTTKDARIKLKRLYPQC